MEYFDGIDTALKSRILYQSEACVVVNKLPGEAAQGARDEQRNLPLMLKKSLNMEFIEAVHRLDVPVTGCSLFALNSISLKYLNAVFKEFSADREKELIDKKYWVIVEKPPFILKEQGELVHWIETNSRLNKSFAHTALAVHNSGKKGCKKAALQYRITGEGLNYLFIEVRLLSGRHHQIRSQFAAIGLHIKGDLKYGAKRSEKSGIRLHARSLSFPNPLKKCERISVTADPPQPDNLWNEFAGFCL